MLIIHCSKYSKISVDKLIVCTLNKIVTLQQFINVQRTCFLYIKQQDSILILGVWGYGV